MGGHKLGVQEILVTVRKSQPPLSTGLVRVLYLNLGGLGPQMKEVKSCLTDLKNVLVNHCGEFLKMYVNLGRTSLLIHWEERRFVPIHSQTHEDGEGVHDFEGALQRDY